MSYRALRSLVRRVLGPTGVGERLRFVRVTQVVRELALPEQAIVLDAGCGEGVYAFALARRHPNWQIDAVDLDAQVVRRCQERRDVEGLVNVRFERRDVRRLGASRQYDLILAVDLLEHIEDHREALRSLAQALRSGGSVILHVPTPEQYHPFAPSRRALEAEMASGDSHHRRSGHEADELLAELERLGLRQAEVTHTFGPFVALLWDLDWWLATGPLRRALRALLFPLTLLVPRLDTAPRRGKGNGFLVVARKS